MVRQNKSIVVYVLLSIFFGAVLFLLTTPHTAEATSPSTYTVCPVAGTGCSYVGVSGIRSALTAIAGQTTTSTIHVKAGNYSSNTPLLIGDLQQKVMIDIGNVNVILEGEPGTILDGMNSDAMAAIWVQGTTNVTIRNFIIKGFKGGANFDGVGILVSGDTSSTKATITNLIIDHNAGTGITNTGLANVTITNNTLAYNEAGISLYDSSRATIANNIVVFNSHIGIGALSVGNFTASQPTYNILFENTPNWNTNFSGVWPPSNSHNYISTPGFVNDTSDYHLQTAAYARHTGDPAVKNPDNSASDIGAYGGPGACGIDSTLAGCVNAPPVSIIPNCTNLTGPSSITLGQSGTFSADFTSPQGELRGGVSVGKNGTSVWDPPGMGQFFGATVNSGTASFTWTPNAIGTYDVYCRSWNDSRAECRGLASYVDHTPRYPCAGPNSSKVVTVVAAAPSCTKRPQGDANCDGIVDEADYLIFKTAMQGKPICPNCSADFNNDTKVNLVDYEIWRNTVYN